MCQHHVLFTHCQVDRLLDYFLFGLWHCIYEHLCSSLCACFHSSSRLLRLESLSPLISLWNLLRNCQTLLHSGYTFFFTYLPTLDIVCFGGRGHCVTCGVFIPQPGIEPRPIALKQPSLNHWTAREFPSLSFELEPF